MIINLEVVYSNNNNISICRSFQLRFSTIQSAQFEDTCHKQALSLSLSLSLFLPGWLYACLSPSLLCTCTCTCARARTHTHTHTKANKKQEKENKLHTYLQDTNTNNYYTRQCKDTNSHMCTHTRTHAYRSTYNSYIQYC